MNISIFFLCTRKYLYIFLRSEIGFFGENEKIYFERRKIKIFIKRQLIRFNYENKLNNSKAIAAYNDYILEQVKQYSPKTQMEYAKSGDFNYTESEFVELFFEKNRKILYLKGLIPVFVLYGLGIGISLFVFCLEIVFSYVSK